MTWQGIPYPLSNILESSYLTVGKIPTVVVETGFAWENVIGAFIAGVIPAYIAWYTIRRNIRALEDDRKRQQESFDKDRDAQLDIASKNLNAQVLSNNRQQWINNLRDLISEYLSLATDLLLVKNQYNLDSIYFDDINRFHDKCLASGKPMPLLVQDKLNAARVILDKSRGLLSEKKSREILLVTKIKMMMNPSEEPYNDLSAMFLKVVACYSSLQEQNDFSIKLHEMKDFSNEILAISQKLLKYEWERVKLMN